MHRTIKIIAGGAFIAGALATAGVALAVAQMTPKQPSVVRTDGSPSRDRETTGVNDPATTSHTADSTSTTNAPTPGPSTTEDAGRTASESTSTEPTTLASSTTTEEAQDRDD